MENDFFATLEMGTLTSVICLGCRNQVKIPSAYAAYITSINKCKECKSRGGGDIGARGIDTASINEMEDSSNGD